MTARPPAPRDMVVEFFTARGLKQASPSSLAVDYFQEGILDSLEVIELISELEGALDVRFENADFEDPRFKTVGGLIEILEGKRADGST